MQEPEQEKCGTTHYAGCACHEQGWENKWKAAIEMAAQASVERDEYAAMLCDAMRWVYVCDVTNQNRADMIDRFEALELTPSNSLENAIAQTPPDSDTKNL